MSRCVQVEDLGHPHPSWSQPPLPCFLVNLLGFHVRERVSIRGAGTRTQSSALSFLGYTHTLLYLKGLIFFSSIIFPLPVSIQYLLDY